MTSWTCRAVVWLASLAAIGVIATASLLAVPRQSAAMQQGGTSIYVEGVSVAPGERTTTTLLLRTGEATSVTSFSLSIAYDESLVRPVSVRTDSFWASTAPSTPSPGSIQLGGLSDAGCLPGNSCPLAQIEWEGLSQGEGQLHVNRATLTYEDQDVTFAVTDGVVHVNRTFDAPVETPGERLGVGTGMVLVLLIVLAGMALGGPLVWLVVRVRKLRTRRDSPGQVPIPSVHTPDLADELTIAVAAYLNAYEAGAQIDAAADSIYDQMAREAANAGGRTPDPLAGDR